MYVEQAKKLLPIITAFVNGKTIQGKIGKEWIDSLGDPNFNSNIEWRIKPKPKTVPLTIEDLYEHFKKGTIFKNQYSSLKIRIVALGDTSVYVGGTSMTFSNFAAQYTFEDGSSLTKIVEE